MVDMVEFAVRCPQDTGTEVKAKEKEGDGQGEESMVKYLLEKTGGMSSPSHPPESTGRTV